VSVISNAAPETFTTVDEATEETMRIIKWLEYIPETEYAPADKKALLERLNAFIQTAQPIASKYIDGE
jgi:hypothetical protein